jgi:hypothetical protein
MNRQQQIDAFTLAAHRQVMARLLVEPELADEAIGVLRRWRLQAGGSSHCDVYWCEWEGLLRQGARAVEAVVCEESSHAATLRSVSPLGRFLANDQRLKLLRQSRQTT